jgi:hypothetical protein
MARRIRSNILTTRTSRLEQEPRTKPYFVLIANRQPWLSFAKRVSSTASGYR